MATRSVSSIVKLPWGSQVLPKVVVIHVESGQTFTTFLAL
jgi:hypothetical protein